MRVVTVDSLKSTGREVHCPNGGFISMRLLLECDGMGFSLHHTIVPVGPPQHWHYKNHLEACYCAAGFGILTDKATGERHMITPGTLYALDRHDDHTLMAIQEMTLICVFNPPVTGREVHREDGSYDAG